MKKGLFLFALAIAFQGCGNGKDADSSSREGNACGAEACPETLNDSAPASAIDDRMIGFWKDSDGNVVRIFKNSKEAPLTVIGNTLAYKGKPLFFESMNLAPDAKTPGAYSAEGQLKDSTDKTSAYFKIEDDGRMRYSFNLHAGNQSYSHSSWLKKIDERLGNHLFLLRNRELGMTIDAGTEQKCLATVERSSTLQALTRAADTAVENHFPKCLQATLKAMISNQDRQNAISSIGLDQILIKNSDAGIYQVLNEYQLVTREQLNQYFNLLASKIANAHEADCRDSRMVSGQTYCVSMDGYKVALFSKMIDANPQVTDLRAIYDGLTEMDEATIDKAIQLVRSQNQGSLPKDNSNRLTSWVIRNNVGLVSTDQILFVIDLFRQSGWDLDETSQSPKESIRKELIKNGDPELYRYFHLHGVKLGKDDIAYARLQLRDARTQITNATLTMKVRVYYYEYAQNLKSLISIATSDR